MSSLVTLPQWTSTDHQDRCNTRARVRHMRSVLDDTGGVFGQDVIECDPFFSGKLIYQFPQLVAIFTILDYV